MNGSFFINSFNLGFVLILNFLDHLEKFSISVYVRLFTRIFLLLLVIASAVVPIESYLDSMEFTSHKKQLIEPDEEFYSVAIAIKSFIEFDSDGEFFNHPHLTILSIPPITRLFELILKIFPVIKFLRYSLIYLPPPA